MSLHFSRYFYNHILQLQFLKIFCETRQDSVSFVETGFNRRAELSSSRSQNSQNCQHVKSTMVVVFRASLLPCLATVRYLAPWWRRGWQQ
jgi:hypothetical protein